MNIKCNFCLNNIKDFMGDTFYCSKCKVVYYTKCSTNKIIKFIYYNFKLGYVIHRHYSNKELLIYKIDNQNYLISHHEFNKKLSLDYLDKILIKIATKEILS